MNKSFLESCSVWSKFCKYPYYASSRLCVRSLQRSNNETFIQHKSFLRTKYQHPFAFYSSEPVEPHSPAPKTEPTDKKLSLIQRFKNTYSIYGKVVILIHGVTSCLWFASFYGIATSGINLLEFLENVHAPEWICHPLRIGSGTVNTLATTLVLYKLAAPARYMLTLVLTKYVVQYMRIKGKAPKVDDRDRLRNLAKESAQISRERLKVQMNKSRKNALIFTKKLKR